MRLNTKFLLLLTLSSASLLYGGTAPAAASNYQLINQKGDVTIIYETERDQARTGLTQFRYHWQRHFSYTYKSRQNEQGIALTITVQATIKPTISHTIYMPEKERDSAWHNRLLAHEYDHVCISLDQRPRLILEHLISNFTMDDIQLKKRGEITTEWINSKINQRIAEYENAVEELVRANYSLLDHDNVSSHGKKEIKNRAVFFKKLYQQANLRINKFKYLDEVEPLLKSEPYMNARTYYLDLTKTKK